MSRRKGESPTPAEVERQLARLSDEAGGAEPGRWEPRIPVFACNWCSYAGADNAGVTRIRYPSNVRLIRTMCSGRVHPGMILEAFRRGADGVVWSGCHFGDCHYVFGNYRAKEQYEKTREMVAMLGLEPQRLRLEWVSAAEGPRFAALMREMVEEVRSVGPSPIQPLAAPPLPEKLPEEALERILEETAGRRCMDCGKCTTLCPVAMSTRRSSPRRTLLRLQDASFRGDGREVLAEEMIQRCLTCALCQAGCPAGVDYPGLVRSLRSLMEPEEVFSSCAHGAALLEVARIQAASQAPQERLGWFTEDLEVAEEGDTLLFVGCLPYQAVLFRETSPDLLEGARGAVRLLNRMGIRPVVSREEVCCGHDLYWSGEEATFRRLAHRNAEWIRGMGFRRVVTLCPECAHTLRDIYAREGVGLAAEVVPLVQLLAEHHDGLREVLPQREALVTYHDGCRMARYLGRTEEPRQILGMMPGVRFAEMPRRKAFSPCCGTVAWRHCGPQSRAQQEERLREAAATGAHTMITACHKCKIHYDCLLRRSGAAQGGRPALERDLKVQDLASFLAGSEKGGAVCLPEGTPASASSSANAG
jgi:Fe-S oxidoreductase/coenzyme F420-reducing hydrogenase delta subunit